MPPVTVAFAPQSNVILALFIVNNASALVADVVVDDVIVLYLAYILHEYHLCPTASVAVANELYPLILNVFVVEAFVQFPGVPPFFVFDLAIFF